MKPVIRLAKRRPDDPRQPTEETQSAVVDQNKHKQKTEAVVVDEQERALEYVRQRNLIFNKTTADPDDATTSAAAGLALDEYASKAQPRSMAEWRPPVNSGNLYTPPQQLYQPQYDVYGNSVTQYPSRPPQSQPFQRNFAFYQPEDPAIPQQYYHHQRHSGQSGEPF
ncbi:MAG: hypothetical protein SGCHY_005417 [Lobulomycetales sp.]